MKSMPVIFKTAMQKLAISPEVFLQALRNRGANLANYVRNVDRAVSPSVRRGQSSVSNIVSSKANKINMEQIERMKDMLFRKEYSGRGVPFEQKTNWGFVRKNMGKYLNLDKAPLKKSVPLSGRFDKVLNESIPDIEKSFALKRRTYPISLIGSRTQKDVNTNARWLVNNTLNMRG